MALPLPALAHGAGAGAPDGAQDGGVAIVMLALALPLLLYLAGDARLRRERGTGMPARRTACFIAGEVALALCLLPPLDDWAAGGFASHMVQHELLMLVAAPLLVLGRPLPVFLWAFPAASRRRIGAALRVAPVRRAWSVLLHPGTGWLAHALALWLWHAPALFRAALANPLLHDLQHASFVLTALLFWSGLLMARAVQRGTAVLYLFTTTVHTGVLGALITLARQPLYAPDIAAASPAALLQDQQLGGLIMWVPGAMVYVAAGLAMFLQWVRSAEAA